MSGIVGLCQLDEWPLVEEIGVKLLRNYESFPADDIRYWRNEKVFFGCHMQWITPESRYEKLPFYDHEQQLAITADAIVDNRAELFERLQVHHSERTRITDSELLLLAYRRWGSECPKYIVGDYAFLIWDESEQRLFGARDFSGARTLYYVQNAHYVAFSTLMEPLFSLPQMKKELNEQWLAEYLAIPGMLDATDIHSTVYMNLQQLAPGHTILVKNGAVTTSRYHYLQEGNRLSLKSNEEYEEAFKNVFTEAISARLRSSRKIGAHLSGGLDSGAVVSFAAPMLKAQGKPLHSFSYIPIEDFNDWTSKRRLADETPYIQETIQYVGNINAEFLRFKEKNPYSDMDEWLDIMEMPYKFYANSFWLKGIFEQAQQMGIDVMLNGQRGNTTISFGNALEYQLNLFKKLKWLKFYQEVQAFSQKKGVKASQVIKVLRKKAAPRKNAVEIPLLIHPNFARRMNVFQRLEENGLNMSGAETWGEFRRKHFQYAYNWNVNGTYSTKLSLRYRVWDRDPTNDLRVIRFCLSLPDHQYVQQGMDRALIRRAAKGYLPDKIRLNHRIRGIQGADGVDRMATVWKEFITEVEDLDRNEPVKEYINPDVVKKALGKIRSGPKSEFIYDPDFSLLMRSVIVNRFLRKNFEGR